MPEAVLRGQIRYRNRKLQVNDLSGLRYGNVTGTDIEVAMERQNRGFLFVDVKLKDKELDYGQRLFYERLCDNLSRVKPCVLIIAEHTTLPSEDIDVAICEVRQIRYGGKWIDLQDQRPTVRELADRFWISCGLET